MGDVTFVNDDKSRSNAAPSAPGDSTWWKADPAEKQDVHADVVPYVKRLMVAWSRMAQMDRRNDLLYENREVLSYVNGRAALERYGYQQSDLMATTSIVDTFHSRFAKRRPQPMFVVDNADWSLKHRAQRYQEFVRGKMSESGADELGNEALHDAIRRGSGILYIDEDGEDIVVERVHRWELFIDPHEARSGGRAIRQAHRVMRIAKEVLAALFPKYADLIDKAPASRPRPHETVDDWTLPTGIYDSTSMIDVYLSWHLTSGKDADDGRKAICIENATLLYEERDCPRLPFAVLHQHMRPEGFWGQGTCERLAKAQRRVNEMIWDIDQNVSVAGKLIVFTNEQMDNTPTEKLTGVRPFRVRVRGAMGAVQHVTPQPFHPASLQLLQWRIQSMHNMSGVAEWSAQGRSPLGNGASGVAIDTMEDILSDRHATFEMRYAAWRCLIAQLIIDAARSLTERWKAEAKKPAEGEGKRQKRKLVATWLDRGSMKRLDFDSVALEEEQYKMQIEPTSYLPSTRAGKLAAITELTKTGFLPQWVAQAMFDEPDLAFANRIALAKYNRAIQVMEILADPDQEVPVPDPHGDYELHEQFAIAYYNYAQTEHAPEEVLQRYRDYIDLVQSAKGVDAPPPGAGAPMDPMAAAAGGMPMDPMAGAGGMAPGGPPMPMPGGPMPAM